MLQSFQDIHHILDMHTNFRPSESQSKIFRRSANGQGIRYRIPVSGIYRIRLSFSKIVLAMYFSVSGKFRFLSFPPHEAPRLWLEIQGY